MTLRERILSAQPEYVDVPVPMLGGAVVRVRQMLSIERDAFEQDCIEEINGVRVFGKKNIRAKLIVRCATDPDSGELIFTEADADALGRTRADLVNLLWEPAARLSGITKQDEDDLGKGSGSNRGGDSVSTSPGS